MTNMPSLEHGTKWMCLMSNSLASARRRGECRRRKKPSSPVVTTTSCPLLAARARGPWPVAGKSTLTDSEAKLLLSPRTCCCARFLHSRELGAVCCLFPQDSVDGVVLFKAVFLLAVPVTQKKFTAQTRHRLLLARWRGRPLLHAHTTSLRTLLHPGPHRAPCPQGSEAELGPQNLPNTFLSYYLSPCLLTEQLA